jgi:hypothetical protein
VTSYSMEEAKNAALKVVMTCAPYTIQDVLDTMRRLGYDHDDMNRRAVLYLLDEERIAVERVPKRVRIVDRSGGSYEAFLRGM